MQIHMSKTSFSDAHLLVTAPVYDTIAPMASSPVVFYYPNAIACTWGYPKTFNSHNILLHLRDLRIPQLRVPQPQMER
jgi:hypothetical protein